MFVLRLTKRCLRLITNFIIKCLNIFGARVKYSIGAVKIDTLIIYEITALRIADKVKHALSS